MLSYIFTFVTYSIACVFHKIIYLESVFITQAVLEVFGIFSRFI